MEAKTLTALKASIEHWRRMETGTTANDEEPYGQDCALCQLFVELNCEGCPV